MPVIGTRPEVIKLAPVIKELERYPQDWILIQGDTTTTFISALIGFYHKIRIAHIETGLRAHNKYRPFPEEINRRLTGVLTDFHFAPTQREKSNLVSDEGIPKEAPSLGKPVLILREVTERPEALEAGTIRVVGLDKNKIVRQAQRLFDDEIPYEKMSKAANPCMHSLTSMMPYYVALSNGVDPKTLGLAKEGSKAYLQCLDPCELTGGDTVVFEVGLRK